METVQQEETAYKHLSKGLVKSAEHVNKELVDGFKFISGLRNVVGIFGSGRLPEHNIHYRQAMELAELLAKKDFAVITGGGPGIMEAANRGAVNGGGRSLGLNIVLPHEQNFNPYVQEGVTFDHFFTRKVVFKAASSIYVFFPGGFGTLDEFFEIVNLIHNQKIKNPPFLIAVGNDYWQPLLTFLEKTVYEKHQAIDTGDFKIIHLVDSPQEAFEMILKNHGTER